MLPGLANFYPLLSMCNLLTAGQKMTDIALPMVLSEHRVLIVRHTMPKMMM
jgi:hypothetical protein